jgi:hypothetical protein
VGSGLEAAFPGEYAKDAPLRAIGSLHLAGAVLLASAAAVMAYRVVLTTLWP